MDNNSIAIVTGAGTGIGAATAKRLAQDGMTVIICYRSSEKGAQETLKAVTDLGGNGIIFKVDIKNNDEVKQLFNKVVELGQPLHAVINNAGIAFMKNIADISDEEYNHSFDTNTRGTFNMCRAAAQHIADNGRIINISTGATHSGYAGLGLYIASKLAIEGFSKTLVHELGPRGITVNSISPGLIDTPILDGDNLETGDYLRETAGERAALKRIGQPNEVADLIAALVSKDGRWVSGQNIHVDGGTIIT